MRLSDILRPGTVRVAGEARDKKTVIRELVDLVAGSGDVTGVEAVYNAVLEREALKTTGIGQGLATPHAKTSAVRRLVMGLMVLRSPVEFDSLDGRPVNIVILLLAPPDQTGPYIQALARVSKLMSQEALRNALPAAPDGADAYRLLIEAENKLLGH